MWTPVGTGLSTTRDGAITARPKQAGRHRRDSRDTSIFVTSCPIGMSLPAEGRVSLHFTQPGLSMPLTAGVMGEKGSKYKLAQRPRELDGHPPGGVWVGVWFSSRLYHPFSKGLGQHIIQCLKNKKCENK